MVSNEIRTLIAVGHVADHIQEMTSRQLNECSWEAFGEACLKHLMLGETELQDLSTLRKNIWKSAQVEYWLAILDRPGRHLHRHRRPTS
jgi:hypothetical protein